MNEKLAALHGQEIHIRYKPSGFYRVFIANLYYMDGEIKRQISADDEEVHIALVKLAMIFSKYPLIVA